LHRVQHTKGNGQTCLDQLSSATATCQQAQMFFTLQAVPNISNYTTSSTVETTVPVRVTVKVLKGTQL
jgi:hypothetical protein